MKTAIVTGAGSGVGKATAQLLAREGFKLTLVGRTSSKLEATAKEIGDETECIVASADLAQPDGARDAVAAAMDAFGQLDVVAHIAGYASLRPVEDITAEEWRQTIDANLSSAVYLAKEAWPIFKKQGRGMVVNVSSMASLDPFPHFSMYAAAKAGLNMFTQCLGKEGGESGIKAVCIAPGAIETSMLRGLFSEQDIPAASTLSPEDVATVIVDCITSRRDFEPGQTIAVPSP